MKTKLTLLALALGASTCLVTAQDDPPSSDNQAPPQHTGGPGGAGGQRGGPRVQGGFHLLPPRAVEQLKLTDEQKQQIAALEAETKAKVEKILTPEQLDQLKNMRPPMGQGGPNGPMMRGGPNGPGPGLGSGQRQGPGRNFPPGPPPGDGGNGNFPPPGPPPGDN